MNRTTNYSLDQWEMSDRLRMEDFNADNGKLKQALAGNAAALVTEMGVRQAAEAALEAAMGNISSVVKLLDITLSANTTQWDIGTSGIDLAQYQKLFLCPKICGSSSAEIYLRDNNIFRAIYSKSGGALTCGASIPIAPGMEFKAKTGGSSIGFGQRNSRFSFQMKL